MCTPLAGQATLLNYYDAICSLAYIIALWGDAFTEHGVIGIGKIFVVEKYLVTPSVFKLQKWFLHQNGVEFNKKSKSDLTKLWPVAVS